jgi:dolichol-phosphate mannosyltransferase
VRVCHSKRTNFLINFSHLQITTVIPTYNEAANLPQLVTALFSLPLDVRVLVVDDNSPDGTGKIADELAGRDSRVRVLHREGKLGLRSAYLEGFRRAIEEGADAVLQMDADFSHDPKEIPAMMRKLESCDVVLGSRYISGGSVDDDWPLWRKSLSAFANIYARALLGLPQQDVTTGFRLWRRGTLLGLPFDRIQSNGYIFLVEMAYLAHCLEYKIGEVPIYFADRRWGKSKMSVRIQVEAAFRIWSVRWNYRDLLRAGKRARISQK